MLLRATSLILAATMASACTGYGSATNGGTPGNEPGPAFEMTVVGQVVCPDSFAATCVRVRVLNFGTAGDGTCRLIAGSTGPHGEFEIEGPQVVLNGVASGSTVMKTVPWTKALPTDPNFYFGSTCSPGLRS